MRERSVKKKKEDKNNLRSFEGEKLRFDTIDSSARNEKKENKRKVRPLFSFNFFPLGSLIKYHCRREGSANKSPTNSRYRSVEVWRFRSSNEEETTDTKAGGIHKFVSNMKLATAASPFLSYTLSMISYVSIYFSLLKNEPSLKIEKLFRLY